MASMIITGYNFFSIPRTALSSVLLLGTPSLGKYVCKEQYEQKWKWPVNILVLGTSTLSMGTSIVTSLFISSALLSIGHAIAYYACPQPISKRESNTYSSAELGNLDVSYNQEPTEFEIGRKKGGIKTRILKGILEDCGYSLDREGKKHEIWKKNQSQVSIPRGVTIAKGTAQSILKQVADQQGFNYNELKKQLK